MGRYYPISTEVGNMYNKIDSNVRQLQALQFTKRSVLCILFHLSDFCDGLSCRASGTFNYGILRNVIMEEPPFA